METLHKNQTVLKTINLQFKIIGENVKYEDFPEDGIIEKGKKKMKWWDYYLFKDEEEYLKWKKEALEMLDDEYKKKFPIIDMIYGLNYHLPQTQKEGQLALF